MSNPILSSNEPQLTVTQMVMSNQGSNVRIDSVSGKEERTFNTRCLFLFYRVPLTTSSVTANNQVQRTFTRSIQLQFLLHSFTRYKCVAVYFLPSLILSLKFEDNLISQQNLFSVDEFPIRSTEKWTRADLGRSYQESSWIVSGGSDTSANNSVSYAAQLRMEDWEGNLSAKIYLNKSPI